MKNSNPYAINHYYQTQVSTADKREIIVLLYDGAIRYMNRAIAALAENNVPDKCKYLTLAMDIVMELTCMLDFEKGGEISKNLSSLYTFTLQELLHANTKNTLEEAEYSIRHSITIMSTLREGWVQILKQQSEDESENRGETKAITG